MNENYGLTYPKETDFYDINVFNSNFSCLADAIDSTKNNVSKERCEIVVASENSDQALKKKADFICPESDAGGVFKQALDAVENYGIIRVLTGVYYFTSTVNIDKPVIIQGGNNGCRFQQKAADSVKAILNITARDVELRNMCFADGKGNSSEPLIYVQGENIVVDTCWFEQYKNYDLSVNTLYFKNCAAFMRITNCCFARMESDASVFINCKTVNSAGIISGNYGLANNDMINMPIKVWVKDSASRNRLMTGSQNTEFVVGS